MLMYVVVVDFEIKPDVIDPFRRLIRDNARRSVNDEPGCRQFDVCVDPTKPTSIFLYEVYDDRAAFDAHLKTAHFKEFDAATASMLANKQVRLLSRVEPVTA
jgi:quinol monooxygenase YgiN